MPTTVNIYRSTDASAPSLTGAAGSLIALLDACLVSGYGAKSGAGWTKPYSNSGNKGCWRNSTSDGTGFYLYIDDSGPNSSSYREARCTGFQTMSALGTGSGQFPTSAQLAYGIGSVIARKSATADSTARAWTLISDTTVFYLFMETGDLTNPTMTSNLFFGDFFSYTVGDPGRCMIIGRNAENTGGSNYEWSSMLNGPGSAAGNVLACVLPGHFLAGNFTGAGGSLSFGKHSDIVKLGLGGLGSFSGVSGAPNYANGNTGFVGANPWYTSSFPYPNPADGGLYMAPIWVHHSGILRGYLKGLWCPLHHLPMSHGDTFSGTGAMNGKTFAVQNTMVYASNNSSYPAQFFIESSSTWS